MTLLEQITMTFPEKNDTQHTLQELAAELWTNEEVEKVQRVKNWTDALDIDADNISDFGFCGIYQFMEADMFAAYLPALLYFALSGSYHNSSAVTNLVALLDPEKRLPSVDVDRIDYLQRHTTSEQKRFISEAFVSIAQRDFKENRQLTNRLLRLAEYWSEASA